MVPLSLRKDGYNYGKNQAARIIARYSAACSIFLQQTILDGLPANLSFMSSFVKKENARVSYLHTYRC